MSTSMTPSGLKLHNYTDGAWYNDVVYNITRLNNTLLKLSAMGDVALTGLTGRQAIRWDVEISKYVNFFIPFPTYWQTPMTAYWTTVMSDLWTTTMDTEV
ncbi:MAG: hypothetical protein PF503_06190 [Desulfobacula sp.]|jgi:hypothetical protein|nr:hypothetical protein [Desulfobacula sp.]